MEERIMIWTDEMMQRASVRMLALLVWIRDRGQAIAPKAFQAISGRIRKGWKWAKEQGLLVALAIFVTAVVLAWIIGRASGLPAWAVNSLTIVVAIGAGFWVYSGFEVIGEAPVRHVAIKTIFGRPASLVRMGLIYRIRGVHGLWRVPTGKYWWQYVVEGHTLNNWWTKVVIRIDFNWPTPNPDDPNEDPNIEFFPFPGEDLLKAGKGLSWKEASELETSEWKKKSSYFLLKRAFYRFPWEPIEATVADLQEFFRGAITGPVLTILGEVSREDFVGQQEKIEAAVRIMALSETGDPIVDCGIPANSLNIKIVRVEPITDGAKESLEAEQRAENEGMAHRAKMKHESEGAENEANRVTMVKKAFMGEGGDVSGMTAAVLTSTQVRGDDLPLEKLMMLRIIEQQSGEKALTPEEIVALRQLRQSQSR